jgi:small conductance mechanosensitive channel
MTLLALTHPVLPEPEKLIDMAWRIGLTIVVGFVFQRLLFLAIARAQIWMRRAGGGGAHAEQRAHTLGQIFRNLVTVLLMGAVVIHSLDVLGWDVKPLLAGAGILGVALGFGAQTLVRDVIAGFFILSEDQFSIGDLIEIDGKAATVEALTVRSTTLRDFNGHMHFVPNGEMKVVVNRSRGWIRRAGDVPVAAGESAERALAVCRRVAENMSAESAWAPRLLDPIQVWGLETFEGTESRLRLVVRARPGADAPDAARELRLRIHRAFTDADIHTSTPRDINITPFTDPAAGPASRAS